MKQNICVYCGASDGLRPEYTTYAQQLGKAIALQHRRLVYGGGNRGLMGVIANAVISHGGEVIGIIPERLVKAETAHQGITHLEVVQDMHQRKARMAELADSFIAMPGGTGTLEELYEVWTAAQIGYHQKPVSLFNIAGFYDKMLAFLEHAVAEGFIRRQFYETLIVTDDTDELFQKIDHYFPQNLERWIKK
ncbi:TIGR00730 family Rossman fold protein [Utexia brackfieldae]|uniref:LOG family protein n=1 Tax=Utexia brackfieldae TaxID=3074108 RepID=UPI00370DB244